MDKIIACFKQCLKPNKPQPESPVTKPHRHSTFSMPETPEKIPEYVGDREDPTLYCKGGYHPVKANEMYVNRYTVVRKLGWGHFSTVWLCWDLQDRRHKALKIVRSAADATEAAMNEIKLHKCVRRAHPNPNSKIVKLLDYFIISGANGNHVCMVFDVFGDNLLKLVVRSNYKGLPLKAVKSIIRQVLEALDCLHRTCGIIHTDIKLENVCLDSRESGCADHEVPVILADLGNACWEDHHFAYSIQTRPYRCPEVILRGNYKPNADIWSTACMAFELATGDYLFPNIDAADKCRAQDENHLTLIVRLLGRVPKRFAFMSTYFQQFFTPKGKLIRSPGLKRRGIFEILTRDYEWDDDEARRFADFLMPMLAIDPNDRASAQDSLRHEWLRV